MPKQFASRSCEPPRRWPALTHSSAVGRADDAAADALHLIEADPFRESVWDRRMRALHASGRTVDALRVFQDYRRLLADELGLEPSPELVALERALLTPQSPKESADTTLGSVPGNLPVDSTALVGRVAEIDPLLRGLAWGAAVGDGDVVVHRHGRLDRGRCPGWIRTLPTSCGADISSLLRQAVAENGGVEVKSLGDGLMVVFGAASRALSCAVAMQQYIERDNQTGGQRVGLRVGLSGGEVSCENDDYFGEPVIEAARLCAVCEAGQILAAHIVKLTAGRRTQGAFRSLGELELKGLAHRVDTVEVLWEPLDANGIDSVIPLPGRLGLVPASGVVGRDC